MSIRQPAPIQCTPEKLKEYQPRAEALGLTLVIAGTRWRYWELRDTKAPFLMTTGFDADLNTALNQVARGAKLSEVSLYNSRVTSTAPETSRVVVPTAKNPKGVCALCGVPGGVPCPNLVAKALQKQLALAAPTSVNLHPGRCRAYIRGEIK